MFRLRLTKMRQRHFPFRIWFSQSAAVMGNLEKLVKDGAVGGFKLMSLDLNQLSSLREAFVIRLLFDCQVGAHTDELLSLVGASLN